jgi:L-methionine (R)-S-oxide reductase
VFKREKVNLDCRKYWKVETVVDKDSLFMPLTVRIGEVLKESLGKSEKLEAICRLLKANVSYYDWVGFYLVDAEKHDELLLGPYVGEPTEHSRIPFGKGICGQAAETRETFIVQDVSEETNYLSCNSQVKSEIVTPLIKAGKIIGELDIDSHTLSAFSKEDATFLRRICMMIARIL